MAGRDYMALDVPAWMAGIEVLLVCSNDEIPERHVLALRPDEARKLYDEGRLGGWTPFADAESRNEAPS